MEGQYLHQNAHDPYFEESRGGRCIVRAIPLVSFKLGLRGSADVVEFQREAKCSEFTTKLLEKEGWWTVYPVEYKRGRQKKDDRDAVQLCAQALCLEEMINVKITAGALYYAEMRRREEVSIDNNLSEKIPIGLIPYVQALLLSRHLRGDLEEYPPFLWK